MVSARELTPPRDVKYRYCGARKWLTALVSRLFQALSYRATRTFT